MMEAGEARVLITRAKDALAQGRDVRIVMAGWAKAVQISKIGFDAGLLSATSVTGVEMLINFDAVQAIVFHPSEIEPDV